MPEVTQLVNGTAWIRLTSSDDKAKDLFSTLLFLPMSFTNPYLGILRLSHGSATYSWITLGKSLC